SRASPAEQARAATLAKERAEQALLAAQSALDSKTQELLHSLAMMSAALEATADGIVATDANGMITGFNEQYLNMFRVDRALVDGRDHHHVVAHISAQLEDPDAFRARVAEIYQTSPSD